MKSGSKNAEDEGEARVRGRRIKTGRRHWGSTFLDYRSYLATIRK